MNLSYFHWATLNLLRAGSLPLNKYKLKDHPYMWLESGSNILDSCLRTKTTYNPMHENKFKSYIKIFKTCFRSIMLMLLYTAIITCWIQK